MVACGIAVGYLAGRPRPEGGASDRRDHARAGHSTGGIPGLGDAGRAPGPLPGGETDPLRPASLAPGGDSAYVRFRPRIVVPATSTVQASRG